MLDANELAVEAKRRAPRPPTVSGQQCLGVERERGGDHERVGKPEPSPVPCPERRSLRRDPLIEGHDGDREPLEKLVELSDGRIAAADGTHEALGVSGTWQHEVPSTLGFGSQRASRLQVVTIRRVEKADQDAGVEDGDSHSLRSLSSSSGSYTPVSAPA